MRNESDESGDAIGADVTRSYPPGYFLALVIEHDWPPGFVPQGGLDVGAARRREAALRGSSRLRERLAKVPGKREKVTT